MFVIERKPSGSVSPAIVPKRARPFEHKCACEANSADSGDCEKCKKKKKPMQEAVSIAREASGTPWQTSAARALLRPRFYHNFGSVQLHSSAPGQDQCRFPHELVDPRKRTDLKVPRETAPKVKGTATAIPPGDTSIVCKSQAVVTQGTDTGADKACSEAHERSHIQDWKSRYGNDLCKGVPDGSLPTGGDGYDEFLRKSECKAYKVGKDCRTKQLTTAAAADKPEIQAGIDRDNAQLTSNHCD
jgi:hypothetical protein